MLDIQASARGVAFRVYVQPRASKAAIDGIHQNALKIKLTAPPLEGAANQQCIELLAKALDRPKSTLSITSGRTSRHKQILAAPQGATMTPSEIAALQNRLRHLARQKA